MCFEGWSTVGSLALFSVRNLKSASPLSFRTEHIFLSLATFKIFFPLLLILINLKTCGFIAFVKFGKFWPLIFQNCYLSPLFPGSLVTCVLDCLGLACDSLMLFPFYLLSLLCIFILNIFYCYVLEFTNIFLFHCLICS